MRPCVALLLVLAACSSDPAGATPVVEADAASDAALDATDAAASVDGTEAEAALQEAGPDKAPTCGNGRLDPQEGCDGTLLPEGLGTCDDNNLGTGTTKCTSFCTLDVSGCSDKDYCAGLSFYNDDQCDACEWMGGHADPACAAHCANDGVCADWYDPAVGQWSCLAAGFGPDPDCGVCGDGKVDGHEKCDGAAYAVFQGIQLDSCEVWGYKAGTLSCRANCLPDFSACSD
jgi:hypothetical protein